MQKYILGRLSTQVLHAWSCTYLLAPTWNSLCAGTAPIPPFLAVSRPCDKYVRASLRAPPRRAEPSKARILDQLKKALRPTKRRPHKRQNNSRSLVSVRRRAAITHAHVVIFLADKKKLTVASCAAVKRAERNLKAKANAVIADTLTFNELSKEGTLEEKGQ